MIEKVNFIARRRQKGARIQALELAHERAKSFQQLSESGRPVSEHLKSAAEALQSVENDNGWDAMRSFLNTEKMGALLFGNQERAEEINAIKNRL